MNINPEFQRQLYLECSQARMIGIPLVLGIMFTFGYFIDDYTLSGATANMALTLFMLITLLWGARQTVDSIIEEYRERTWDTQRLSALGPWEMTWGKLFGSTIMVWYSGLICLVVYGLATDHAAALPLLLFYSICAALLVQSGSLLLGLLAVQRGQLKSSSIFILAIVGFMSIAPWLVDVSTMSPANFSYLPSIATTVWYDIAITGQLFHQLSLVLAIFWCGVGNYRLMAQELGIRTLPWVWLGFSLFIIIYIGGFIPSSTYSFSLSAFVVSSGLTYIGVMVERNDAMHLKHFITYFQQGNWRRVAEEMPIWCLSFTLTIPFALILSFSEHPFHSLVTAFHFYPLAILLLLLRDCAVYLYFCYGKNPQRAFSLTLLTGVLLYGIIPGIFSAAGAGGLAALSFPLLADTSGGAISCAALQAILVLGLFYKRWQESI